MAVQTPSAWRVPLSADVRQRMFDETMLAILTRLLEEREAMSEAGLRDTSEAQTMPAEHNGSGKNI